MYIYIYICLYYNAGLAAGAGAKDARVRLPFARRDSTAARTAPL